MACTVGAASWGLGEGSYVPGPSRKQTGQVRQRGCLVLSKDRGVIGLASVNRITLSNFFKVFIYLFMAVLGLRFCARAFSSCGKRGPLFIAVRGPLTIPASLVAEHRLQMRRLSNCGSQA